MDLGRVKPSTGLNLREKPNGGEIGILGHNEEVDMNLLFDGKLYNSKKLRRHNLKNLPEPIRNFIESIRTDEGLRWGGDFNNENPVHIDNDLYRKQKIIYLAKLYSRLNQLDA